MLGNVSAMLEDQETKPTNETRKEAKKCFADESEEHHALEPQYPDNCMNLIVISSSSQNSPDDPRSPGLRVYNKETAVSPEPCIFV